MEQLNTKTAKTYKTHFTWEVSAFVFVMNAVISLICARTRGVGLITKS